MFSIVLLASTPAAASPSFGLDDAVAFAFRHSPRLKESTLDIQAAEAQRKQARGHFGPRFQLELTAAKFDAAPGLGSGMSSDQLAPLQALAGSDPFDNAMVSLFSELPQMFESEAYNVDLTARVVQPLTPLWAIFQRYKLSELGVDLARVAQQREIDQLRFQVCQSYLRALKADTAVRALEQAIVAVQAHVSQAQHLVEAGAISRVELLQAQVRLAELESQLLSAKNGATLARDQLALLINWPTEEPLPQLVSEVREGRGQAPPLDTALRQAMRQRPELSELDIRSRQARRGIKASWQGYLPQISLIGAYQHNEGSIMTPPTWMGAVNVSWDVFEWGASHYKVEEAQHRSAKIQLAQGELRRAIALEVRTAWLKLAEAKERITIAKSRLTHAEEQLRMERERFAVQQSTSTEVLDAQMRLTEAQVEQQNAQYDYLIAEAALKKATGGNR